MRTGIFLLALLVSLTLSESAWAQFGRVNVPNYGPGYRGNISPYLNLLGRGNNLGVDYFLGTRAEQQRRGDRGVFRSDIDTLRGDVLGEGTLVNEQPLYSGMVKPVGQGGYFGNTYGYFGNTRAQPMPARTGGGNPAPARRR
jgi:hypothetical protein